MVNEIPKYCPKCGESTDFDPTYQTGLRKALEQARDVDFSRRHRMMCKHCKLVEYQYVPTEEMIELMAIHSQDKWPEERK